MQEITNIKQLTFPFIKEYIIEQGETDIKWLLDLLDKEMPPDKNGKQRRISFIEVRKEFVLKYMPHLMPTPKEKPPTMHDQRAELEAALLKSKRGSK